MCTLGLAKSSNFRLDVIMSFPVILISSNMHHIMVKSPVHYTIKYEAENNRYQLISISSWSFKFTHL